MRPQTAAVTSKLVLSSSDPSVMARELFKLIDVNGDGSLDRSEIAGLATRLGKSLSEAELTAAMAEMDVRPIPCICLANAGGAESEMPAANTRRSYLPTPRHSVLFAKVAVVTFRRTGMELSTSMSSRSGGRPRA